MDRNKYEEDIEMSEDIKKVPEEILDEELDGVAGGAKDENGYWICKFCAKGIPTVKSNADCLKHYQACPDSPYYKG